MQAVSKEFNDDATKALGEVLKPEQVKRLKQIELQQRGSRAFVDEEVQKALKLTDEQKEKIKGIAEESGKQMRELFGGGQGNREEAFKKMQSLRKETNDKVQAVLSDDQKKAWKELTGEPFEVRFGPRNN